MAQDIKVALTLDNKQFNSALKQSEKQTKSFSNTTKKEVSGLTKAFGALAAAVGIKEVIRLADDFTVLTNRLKAVTNSEQEAASALKLVQQVAKDTRSDLASVASLFADITIAGEELALSQKDVAAVTQTFSQALKVSGADAGTAAGAIRQFGQALASGVLRGDEFNSINEANSKFMGELAKSLGVTRGELRELAKQGKITADVMIDATLAMRENVEDAFSKTTTTIAESFTQLRNSVLGLFGAIGETGVFTTLASAISALASSIDVLTNAGEGLGTLVKILAAIAINVLLLGRVGTATAGVFSKFGGVLTGVATSILGAFKGLGGALVGIFTKMRGGFLTVGNLAKNFGMLFGNAFKSILSLPGMLARAFGTLAVALVAVFGKIAAGAFLALRALTPYTLILYAIAEAVNFLTKKFLDFDLFGWLADKAKGALEVLKKLLVTMGLMDAAEPIEIIDPKQQAIIDDINKQIQEQLDARKFLAEQAAKEKKAYEDFYKGIIDSARETVQTADFMKRALIDLNNSGLSGTDPKAYAEALKLLTKDAKDFTLTMRDATRDVKNFNDSLSTQLSDMQADNDKIEIFNSLQKELYDIERDLTLLRDQTLQGLQEALVEVGGAGTENGKKIVQQMEDVKAATEGAIIAQKDLATEGYETSRTFENGWNQALETFIEASTNEAAKAKEIFETFTKGVEDAFVNFAKTGKLSFKDLLDSMVEMLIRSQVQKLMGSLLSGMGGTGGGGLGGFFKSIFGLAEGGPARGGKPYIVGEQGPELFVPNSSGTVVPNNKLGGGQTVNNTYITNSISAVDAKSVAQLFAENRKTLLGTVQMAQKEMPYG
jgi:lambda family phage tail tape measure protein